MDDLRTYLSNHLFAADNAIALLERCAENHADDAYGDFFAGLLAEVRTDREALASLLRRAGGERGPVKRAASWIAEKLQRAKLDDSEGAAPNRDLLELLEFLSLAVAGKAALWDALEAAAGPSDRFGGLSLAALKRRAAAQRREIEWHRRAVAADVFGVSDEALELPPVELRAVILDVDGTLIDSNDQHARAWVDALAEAGRDIPYEQVRPLIGMGGDQMLPALIGVDAESADGRALERRRGEIFRARYLAQCAPFADVRELLERLRTGGLQLVVATSASEDDLDALLEAAGVADLIDRATSSDDAEESKPEPDIVEAALSRAGCDAGSVLMLGDTPFDVAAAARAGVRVVGLRCGGSGDAELAGAIAVYDDPAALLQRFAESPFAASGVEPVAPAAG
jgi:phosphoglycolate phosphatase-like HAD superfamily hydrolase